MTDFESARLLMKTVLNVYSSYRLAFQRTLRQNNIDLTYEMFQVMRCLWEKEGVSQQELANQTFKDKASLTYLINNLEKRNLVERKDCDKDARSKKIYLTPKGKELQLEVIPLAKNIYMIITEKLNEQNLLETVHYLKELNDIFKKEI